jgi:hypothetical protein
VRNNWRHADHCIAQIDGLQDIIQGDGNRKFLSMAIWDQLRIIVVAFAIAFAGMLAWKA